ncbi:MAG: hypothetical protein D3924_06760 [Candidatus Electrothrix sp. AR4]|nr:hypothetical protein [Candidatus Electrothrix sp. AR4]
MIHQKHNGYGDHNLLIKDIDQLEQTVSTNVVLGVDYLLPILTKFGKIFGNGILISEREQGDNERTVVPSLCITFYKNFPAKPINNTKNFEYELKELGVNCFNSQTIRSVDNICNIVKDKKIYIKRFQNDYTVIILQNDINDEDQIIRRVSKLNYLVRQKSLNYMNDSVEIAAKHVAKFSKSISPSPDIAISNILEILKTMCDCNVAYYEKYHSRDKKKATLVEAWKEKTNFKFRKDESTILISKLQEHISDLKQHKKPIIGLTDEFTYLFFPFISDNQQISFRYIICVISVKPIAAYILTNLRELVKYYFDIYLEKEKIDILDKIQKNSSDNDYESDTKEIGTVISLPLQMVKKLNIELERLLLVSNAFSATIRLYHPSKKSLKRVANASLRYVARKISETESSEIKITEENSANVFTYLNKNKGQHYYLPDLDNVRRVRRKRKNNSTYADHRENALSELCLPIYFFDVCVGVTNFESDQINGLKKDIRYIKSFVLAVEKLVERHYFDNDKEWLTQRSQIYQNLHELQNIICDKRIPEEIRERLGWYVWSLPIDSGDHGVKLEVLIAYLNNYISSYEDDMSVTPWPSIRHDMLNNFKEGCKIWLLTPELIVNTQVIDMIKIIYKNLLDNYRKHSNKERDGLWVYQVKKTNNLIFRMRNSNLFDEDILNDVFVRPIKCYVGEKTETHYGLFIVGMLARYLGGIAYAYNIHEEYKSEILVQIPIIKLNFLS